MLRDMCRQWEREVTFFMEKVLPETEKAMSKSKTADLSQIADLKKAVEWASKTLEPYLFVISALPHRSCPANKSPDMQKATTAFGEARKKLEDLVRTARRLAGNPEGTNIEFEGNLKKVKEEWGDRVQRLATALDNLAREIEAVPGQSDSGSEQARDLSRDRRQAVAPGVSPQASQIAPRFGHAHQTDGFRQAHERFDRQKGHLRSKTHCSGRGPSHHASGQSRRGRKRTITSHFPHQGFSLPRGQRPK